MDNQSFFVAIDVSKDELSVAVDGARVCSYPHTNNGIARLRRWAEQRAQGLALWFVMESTGAYSTSLARRLYGAQPEHAANQAGGVWLA